MFRNIQYAIRQLVRAPGFTSIAILTLAVTIAALAAISAVMDGVLLRPLAYPDPDRILLLGQAQLPLLPEFPTSAPNFIDWKKRIQSLSHMAALTTTELNLSTDGEPKRLVSLKVTAEYFKVYGIESILGRTFLPEEDTPGSKNVILGYGLWQRSFGGDKTVVGRSILLNGESYAVVGVAPRGFGLGDATLPDEVEAWIPMGFSSEDISDANRNWHNLGVVGRLQPNATLDQARAELQLLAAQLAEQYPATNKGWGVTVTSLFERTVRDIRGVLYVLFAAVVCVFLIGCVNVSSLLLTRATIRAKETAVRIALGAGRGTIVRQFLTESVTLAVLGGIGGAVLSYAVLKLIISSAPANLPRASDIHVDFRVLGFCFVLTILAGVAFGLGPALLATRVRLGPLLANSMRGSTEGGLANQLRKSFIVVQVAFACLLLTTAGLLIQTFVKITRVDPGFKAADAIMVRVLLSERQYGDFSRRRAFVDDLLSRLRSLPGVEAVAVAQALPLYGPWVYVFTIEGWPAMTQSEMPTASYFAVGPDYFRAMGIRLVRGRAFTPADTAEAPQVAVINEALARHYLPSVDPIGKRIKIGSDLDSWREIVGVAHDVRESSIAKVGGSQVYEPYAQHPFRFLHVVLRSPSSLSILSPGIKAAVYGADKMQPVAEIRTMSSIVARAMARERFAMIIVALLAAAAVLLAAFGIYGVISYVTVQRTGEFAIRMALGAQSGQIVRLVLGEGAKLIAIGLVIGLAGHLVCSRVLASLLGGPLKFDPVVTAVVAVVLIIVALAACFIPARRATKLDPMTVLRMG